MKGEWKIKARKWLETGMFLCPILKFRIIVSWILEVFEFCYCFEIHQYPGHSGSF